jgi:hypothetical protein
MELTMALMTMMGSTKELMKTTESMMEPMMMTELTMALLKTRAPTTMRVLSRYIQRRSGSGSQLTDRHFY